MKPVNFKGQWLGKFWYGPEYGSIVEGESVTFRLFIDECSDNQFSGKAVDLDGVGANLEITHVEGFIDNGLISFTKQYAFFYQIDENGDTVHDESKAHPQINYEGQYSEQTGFFTGVWEIRKEIRQVGEGWLEDICTGTWEMSKDD